MGAARSIGRRLLWPVRRLLDPRFADVTRRIELTRGELRADITSVSGKVDEVVGNYAASSVEASTFVGTALRDLRADIEAWRAEGVERAALDRLAALVDGTVEDLDATAADVLNFASSHRGFAAQRELWFNPPVVVAYGERSVRHTGVNERIVEVPFAFRALADLPAGARVLDFGSAESTVALALGSLGYSVTALDLRPYPLAHPNVTGVATPIEEWDAEPGRFDAVLCISTLEHIGLGWYGDPADAERGDLAALARLFDLLRPGGLLVLTVPYGTASLDATQRRYDRDGLDALLVAWEVEQRVIVEQRDAVTWVPVNDSTRDAVALVAARRPPVG